MAAVNDGVQTGAVEVTAADGAGDEVDEVVADMACSFHALERTTSVTFGLD
jgi:hypothetical protein